jgi:hypothetical protein
MAGSNENASHLEKYLNESLELEINEDDLRGLLSMFERVPPFLLKIAVSRNMNAVKSFESQIEDYKSQLTDEDRLKIRKIIEMPIPELQKLLNKVYLKTNYEQFKILSNAKAKSFLALNLQELKVVLFNE